MRGPTIVCRKRQPKWERRSVVFLGAPGVSLYLLRRITLFVDGHLAVGGVQQIDIQALGETQQIDDAADRSGYRPFPVPPPLSCYRSVAGSALRSATGSAPAVHRPLRPGDICQDRSRLFDHAARHFSSLLRSGFNATGPTGSQFRVWPDHRAGLAAFACS